MESVFAHHPSAVSTADGNDGSRLAERTAAQQGNGKIHFLYENAADREMKPCFSGMINAEKTGIRHNRNMEL
jgi:hypothetical protein